MRHRAVLHFLCAFGVFQKGLTALIETQRTVLAAVGEEARFSCQLMQSKDVLQVTWQKLLPDKEETLATSNKYFGQKVNPDFGDKVEFEAAGLQNSSIVIRNVTEEDEGCYHCLFNTYPEGALTGTTCLQLCELHEPILHVRESNSAEEAVVSCSATGRPAPTATLRVLRHDVHFSNHSSVCVYNTNGTVTVTTTAVLSRFHDNSTQVGCAVRVPSGPQKEVFMMIPEVKQSSADGVDEESGSDNSDFNFTWIILMTVVFICICVAAVIILVTLRKLKHLNRDSEDIKTPQKTIQPAHGNKTPLLLIKEVNEQIRQRLSTGKKEQNNPPKASSSKIKRQLY